MSSRRPLILSSRVWVRPQAQVARETIRLRSPVLKRSTGSASRVRAVTTTSPNSPSGSGRPVSWSTISVM